MKNSSLTSVFLLLASVGIGDAQADNVYAPPVESGHYILTPKASAAPKIHGPAVFGIRPGSPFLYKIPATGETPLKYEVDGLPAGLSLNDKTGQITGKVVAQTPGEYPVTLRVMNQQGRDVKTFKIVVGDTICLTPPLGWNSWNAWGHGVDQQKVILSAQAMEDKGLAAYGWTYINIDDVWEGERGGKYNAIQANPKTFPDIKMMCDAVHALGLKVGIYSTPWITTYGGYVGGSSDNPDGKWTKPTNKEEKKKGRTIGKYRFDREDARQWAEWGIDYLKYDWQPNDPESIQLMSAALQASGRDVVFSLSNSAPLGSVEAIKKYANCWRTTGDLKDRWDGKGAYQSIADVWKKHQEWLENSGVGGPGHFPDADMLVVGNVVERNQTEAPRPSRLTPDEQYAHISLWTLWSSPMLIGCPIEKIDAFTLGLLTN